MQLHRWNNDAYFNQTANAVYTNKWIKVENNNITGLTNQTIITSNGTDENSDFCFKQNLLGKENYIAIIKFNNTFLVEWEKFFKVNSSYLGNLILDENQTSLYTAFKFGIDQPPKNIIVQLSERNGEIKHSYVVNGWDDMELSSLSYHGSNISFVLINQF